jgi:hypothetical protein
MFWCAQLAIMELFRHDLLNIFGLPGNDIEHFIIGLPAPF